MIFEDLDATIFRFEISGDDILLEVQILKLRKGTTAEDDKRYE